MSSTLRPITSLPAPLRVGVLLAALALPAYWWITCSGLYRWLAELQIGWFDG